MGEKKDLRRQLAALQHETAALTKREVALIAERDLLGDALLDAGLLRIGTPRTKTDRIRAARAGVIVLDDVQILTDAQYRIEQDEQIDERYASSIRSVPARTTAYLSLNLTGDPALLAAIADYVRKPR